MTRSTLILMCTYNGAAYLEEQIQSLQRQNCGRLSIYASDDGSSDNTLALLERWKSVWDKGDFQIFHGPQKGFAENFRSLILKADLAYDFYAFCDQDDIWFDNKLATATAVLELLDPSIPSAYCGATIAINDDGKRLGRSRIMRNPPKFTNAIVQSIAGGNTMVLNASAMQLIQNASQSNTFVSHDWWVYLWVTGCGGHMHYDFEPQIFYRQHESNIVGSNVGATAKIRRFTRLLDGVFRRWTDQNIDGLLANADNLTTQNREFVADFVKARQKGRLQFASFLWRNNVRRQSIAGNISLIVGALLGRI